MPLTLEMGMAKPMPSASVLVAVLIPITSPAALTSGPPELPALMAASVWIMSVRFSEEDRSLL